jgi:hypothetical protein
MPESKVEILHFEIVTGGTNHTRTIDEDETRFWGDWAAVERDNYDEIVRQPSYLENVQFVSGPLWTVYDFLGIDGEIPEDASETAGQAMAKWAAFPETYQMPGHPGVNVQMVCFVRTSEIAQGWPTSLEKITRDAVVFNVRFQLGRSFTQDQFYSALSRFMTSPPVSNAKKIKIAYWAHDVPECCELGDRDEALAIQDITKISFFLAKRFASAAVVALERRIMCPSEKQRQKKIHSMVATEEELARFNDIFSGSKNPI